MPEWMKEFYRAVLKFRTPCKSLRFYVRMSSKEWSVMTCKHRESNVNDFFRLLGKRKYDLDSKIDRELMEEELSDIRRLRLRKFAQDGEWPWDW